MKFLSESTVGLFFRTNWLIFVFTIPLVLLSNVYYDMKGDDRQKEILKEVKKNSNFVIMTRLDGVPTKIEKSPLNIDSKLFIDYLLQEGKRYIIDKEIITNGYKETLNKPMDIFNHAENLSYGASNFFPKNENGELLPEPINDYTASLYKQYRLYQLPESIKILKTKTYKYDSDAEKETFNIKIEYSVLVEIIDVDTNKFKKFVSVAIIDMVGSFNPYDFSTVENPYGLILKVKAVLPYSNTTKVINK